MWGDSSLWLWFVFLWWLVMAEHLFMCLLATYMFFFRKISIQVLCTFFNSEVCFYCWVAWVLCIILDISLLLDISFANTFSSSVGFLFILLISLAMQKLFIVCLFLFSLPLLLESSKKIITKTAVKEFPACFLIGILQFQVMCSSL